MHADRQRSGDRVGRSPETVRRWIRNGLYPMTPLPPEWQRLEDGSPAPNWVAAVALSRNGR